MLNPTQLTHMSCAGRFEFEQCPVYHVAVLRYCLLILAIVAVNAILMWELGAASSTGSSWNEPEGADYVGVGICCNATSVVPNIMLVCLHVAWFLALVHLRLIEQSVQDHHMPTKIQQC